jgi:hypothetical protein
MGLELVPGGRLVGASTDAERRQIELLRDAGTSFSTYLCETRSELIETGAHCARLPRR